MKAITSADLKALKRIVAKLEGTTPIYKTKSVKCPSCRGTGLGGNQFTSDSCEWCEGTGKVRKRVKVS